MKVVDEEMGGVAREQRKRLKTIEDELQDVKRQMGRIWRHIAMTDTVMAEASDRIRELRERQERLEDAAEDARAMLSQRRKAMDDVNTIAAYAQELGDFLDESEPTERRAFIQSFVKEIVVMPGDALLRYTVPMPDDSRVPARTCRGHGTGRLGAFYPSIGDACPHLRHRFHREVVSRTPAAAPRASEHRAPLRAPPLPEGPSINGRT